MSKTFENISEQIGVNYQEENITDSEMVQLIELIGLYLNLKTISKYATDNKMTYNGVKKCRKIIPLFNQKFVIDNL